MHSQLHTTTAETNIINFNCASSNQNFPNLEACNTYRVQDLKNLLSRSSKGRQMFIIHLNTRVSQRIYEIYELLTDVVITPDTIVISETKLNYDSNYNDIQLPGCTFVNKLINSGRWCRDICQNKFDL